MSLLEVRHLSKSFALPGGVFARPAQMQAVDDISFDVQPGETLGLVGESGSGKSTTGRLVLQLEQASAGEVVFDGRVLTGMSPRALKPVRREMQVVFQDPYGALNPRMRVGDFVAEPLVVHDLERNRTALQDRVAGLFRRVGLDPAFMPRYPHEFSGGQRQRINIARAIAMRPRFIVADEAITALDVSIQAQIVNLFQDLQEEMGIAYLFIAHDLSMVRYLSRRVAVMRRGRIVEIGPTEAIFRNPQHGYTRALLSAIPIPDPDLERGRRHLVWTDADDRLLQASALVEVASQHFVLQ